MFLTSKTDLKSAGLLNGVPQTDLFASSTSYYDVRMYNDPFISMHAIILLDLMLSPMSTFLEPLVKTNYLIFREPLCGML